MTTEAAAMYAKHYPGGDWGKVPTAIQRVYIKAAEQAANPVRCANCGSTGDNHPAQTIDGCHWTPQKETTND